MGVTNIPEIDSYTKGGKIWPSLAGYKLKHILPYNNSSTHIQKVANSSEVSNEDWKRSGDYSTLRHYNLKNFAVVQMSSTTDIIYLRVERHGPP